MADQDFFTGTIGGMPGIGSQKTLHMIFVVDTSGSMREDNRMNAVNEAFQRMIPELVKIQEDVRDSFKIYISIMSFNEDPEWIAEPTEIEYFVYSQIEASRYVTYFSRAFEELNKKLSRREFLNQPGKMATPYIMFLTDGAPTEDDNYEPVLTELESNGWFKAAQRYAVLIGDKAINDPEARRAVSSFVSGNEEGIIDAKDAEEIVREVSAKTIVIMDQMTRRRVPEENQKEKETDGVVFPPFPEGNEKEVDGLVFPPFPEGNEKGTDGLGFPPLPEDIDLNDIKF